MTNTTAAGHQLSDAQKKHRRPNGEFGSFQHDEPTPVGVARSDTTVTEDDVVDSVIFDVGEAVFDASGSGHRRAYQLDFVIQAMERQGVPCKVSYDAPYGDVPTYEFNPASDPATGRQRIRNIVHRLAKYPELSDDDMQPAVDYLHDTLMVSDDEFYATDTPDDIIRQLDKVSGAMEVTHVPTVEIRENPSPYDPDHDVTAVIHLNRGYTIQRDHVDLRQVFDNDGSVGQERIAAMMRSLNSLHNDMMREIGLDG